MTGLRRAIGCLFAIAVAASPFAGSAAAQKAGAPVIVGNFFDPQYAESAIFSPDGRLLASLDNSGVTLWDLSTALPLRTLSTRAYMSGAGFTADGKRMVTGHKDGAVRLWDVATGAVLESLRGKPKKGGSVPTMVIGLTVDRKGEFAVAREYGPVVRVWNIATRKPLYSLPFTENDRLAKTQSLVTARMGDDGKRLIVLASKFHNKLDSAGTYDARTGAELSFYDLPENHVFIENGLVTDDEAIVRVSGASCEAGELMLFDLKERIVVAPVFRPADCAKPKQGDGSGKEDEPKELKVHAIPGTSRVLISREGDPQLRIFDAASRKIERTLRWPEGTNTNVIGVSRDGKRVAVAETDRIGVRALETGNLVKELRGFATPADRMVISADGTQVVTQFYRPAGSGAPLDVAISGIEEPRTLAFKLPVPASFTLWDIAPGSRLALGSERDGEIALLSLDGRQAPRSFPVAPLKQLRLVRIAPDAKAAIAIGSTGKDDDEAAYLIGLSDGTMKALSVADANTGTTGVTFSRDGARFALGFRDGSAEIFETATARALKKLPPYSDGGDTRPLAFSPDGTLLAGGAIFDDKAFVWDIGAGKVLRTIELPESLAGYRIPTAVALSHDKKTLAVGLGHRAISSGDIGPEAGGILLLDVVTGKRRLALRGHRGTIRALTFSPNDRMLVSTSDDGTARYWDNSTGKLMATAGADRDGGWFVLSEAGFYAGSGGSADAAASIVRATGAEPVAAAREMLSRPDLIDALLKGDPEGKYRSAAKVLDLSKVALPKR